MVGLFKNKNPGNALVLLFYGLALKFPVFLHPVKPVSNAGDNYLYRLVVRYLDQVTSHAPILYSLLAFLLFFTQATLLNRIANSLRLFPKSNYLVGMALLLTSSLVPEWNSFSSPLLVNSLLIWIWYRMVGLYNNNNPKTSIYNVAVLVGLLPLLYSPALIGIVLLIMALLITRPLRITEWLVALLGLISPYYFLFVILFLTDRWSINKIIPEETFRMPGLPANVWLIAAVVLLLLPFVSGSYLVQKNIGKMQINVRKAWSLLVVMLCIAIIVILIHPAGRYMHWMLAIIPLSAFHAATYYFWESKWLMTLLHWLTFGFAIAVTYQIFPAGR